MYRDYPLLSVIQVHIPRKRSSQSFVFKMKCGVTSNTTHDVLISKEMIYKTYKEICSGEPKKVNLGYNNDPLYQTVENNTLMSAPLPTYSTGLQSAQSPSWEVLSKFFDQHNIEPTWLNCNYSWGWYDEELGEWTGCMGKV